MVDRNPVPILFFCLSKKIRKLQNNQDTLASLMGDVILCDDKIYDVMMMVECQWYIIVSCVSLKGDLKKKTSNLKIVRKPCLPKFREGQKREFLCKYETPGFFLVSVFEVKTKVK